MSSQLYCLWVSIAILITLIPCIHAAGAQCYFPDGTEAANYTSCNAAATQSSCCRPTEACLSNGYCFQQTGYANRISRGACTDSSFGSTACPARCRDVAQNVALTIFQAADTADSSQGNGLFCCLNGYNVTSRQCMTESDGTSAPFSLPAGSVVIDRSNGATLPQNFNSTDAAGSIITVTATAAANATNTPESNNTTAIAAGISVPLGLLLLAALAGCFVLWRNLKKARNQVQGAVHGSVYDGNVQKGVHYAAQEKPYDHAYGGYQSVPREASPPAAPPAEVWSGQMQPVEAPADREVSMADSKAVGK
ncbi:hypothetical protein CLAFUW4_11038 [Fulvia fulva]|uniref:Uncharacterized protein n=1 Tax=Passalora fulva TaxID=5499 RepID=A0A9Q8URP0_PASFU|nr:uncharacterized protein CLAFUR5_10080 [Fulvia fulva]KAK4619760.1 hypothetical protein CLAFUR4_11043 [Fulvia fulva]KAK4620269.1 hypothetical protein CLAFUR0_11049 [Fulvia fulva]UJO19930.1 hypothetical protein CLAFUR5_10080 [Fulvia fulva]WPV17099.1 hypothetical protein CLAFUW4_11038 [Fulvia fulva]WPV32088.1 hypothetical protein CLAFUW7_11035 [Fulvia fulva]